MDYLDYLVDYKKKYKLEEKDVLGMLNLTLRKQVIAFLNGKMLEECPFFCEFSDGVISKITFQLIRKTFSIDDHIFDEGRVGDKLYFITKGNIILWHSKSHTFIKEILEGKAVGEYSFF